LDSFALDADLPSANNLKLWDERASIKRDAGCSRRGIDAALVCCFGLSPMEKTDDAVMAQSLNR
jgi:hypothetical protein